MYSSLTFEDILENTKTTGLQINTQPNTYAQSLMPAGVGITEMWAQELFPSVGLYENQRVVVGVKPNITFSLD